MQPIKYDKPHSLFFLKMENILRLRYLSVITQAFNGSYTTCTWILVEDIFHDRPGANHMVFPGYLPCARYIGNSFTFYNHYIGHYYYYSHCRDMEAKT